MARPRDPLAAGCVAAARPNHGRDARVEQDADGVATHPDEPYQSQVRIPESHPLHPSQSVPVSINNLLAQHWHAHCGTDGTTAAVPGPSLLARTSHFRNVAPADLDAALATWVAAGAVQILRPPCSPRDPGGLIRWIPPADDDPAIDISFPCRPPRGEAAFPTPSGDAGQRLLAYLDLFAGSTLGRVGLDSVLHLSGADPSRFVTSAFVEIDDDLAAKAEASWNLPSPRRGARPPHRLLERDVWSLLLPVGGDPQQGLRIDPFLRILPERTMLIVTSGSPCKQVSRASRNQGIDGILGPHSRCFWAVPLLCWYIQHRRPNLLVHVVQKMVDTILPPHLKAMLDALGVVGATHNLHVDSSDWAPLPRRRFWIGTFPIPSLGDTLHFDRIRNPWVPGWGFHWDGILLLQRVLEANMGMFSCRALTRATQPASCTIGTTLLTGTS